LLVFFVLAYLFTWAYWLPLAARGRGLFDVQVPAFVEFIAGYGPALAAVVVAGLSQGRVGLAVLFASLFRWRVGLRWYLAALLIPPAIQLTALGLHLLTSGQLLQPTGALQLPMVPEGLPRWGQGLSLLLLFILGFDGLGEELGWRGFALPRLLEKRSVLVSSLILGFFWTMWHLPYMLAPGSLMAGRSILLLLVNSLGISIVYTWLFMGTRGSTLLAILFHAAGNTTAVLLGATVQQASDPATYLFGTALNWLLALFLLWRMRVALPQVAVA
jgi:membrane protease YdiL (CAAX protease family)